MRTSERFMRETHAAAVEALSRAEHLFAERAADGEDLDKLKSGLGVLKDAITILADHEKQAKARRGRIDWILTGSGVYYATLGGKYVGQWRFNRPVIITDRGGNILVATLKRSSSLEGASRQIRAWRKTQQKARRT